jgi:hypothetical protein
VEDCRPRDSLSCNNLRDLPREVVFENQSGRASNPCPETELLDITGVASRERGSETKIVLKSVLPRNLGREFVPRWILPPRLSRRERAGRDLSSVNPRRSPRVHNQELNRDMGVRSSAFGGIVCKNRRNVSTIRRSYEEAESEMTGVSEANGA